MRSRPDKNHMHVQRWQARSIQPLFGKVNPEEQRHDLRERRKSSLQRLLHIYIMPYPVSKSRRSSHPHSSRSWIRRIPKEVPRARTIPPAAPSLHTLTKCRGGRFLLFFLYGYSNCRAPPPITPTRSPPPPKRTPRWETGYKVQVQFNMADNSRWV